MWCFVIVKKMANIQRVCTGYRKFGNVMDFEIKISRPGKVMEFVIVC